MRLWNDRSLRVLYTLLLASTTFASMAQTSCQETKRHRHIHQPKGGGNTLAPVDILHQRIHLDLTLGNLIRGACEIELVPRSVGLSSFTLDLEALTVDSVVATTGLWSHTQAGPL